MHSLLRSFAPRSSLRIPHRTRRSRAVTNHDHPCQVRTHARTHERTNRAWNFNSNFFLALQSPNSRSPRSPRNNPPSRCFTCGKVIGNKYVRSYNDTPLFVRPSSLPNPHSPRIPAPRSSGGRSTSTSSKQSTPKATPWTPWASHGTAVDA